jgi:hypothetical protein
VCSPWAIYIVSEIVRKKSMMVRPDMVLSALTWLKRNNVLYEDIHLPTEDELPTTIIVDQSQHADSEDTNIESRLEYTVAFQVQMTSRK